MGLSGRKEGGGWPGRRGREGFSLGGGEERRTERMRATFWELLDGVEEVMG
jgi:hypothetical protein